MERLTVRLFGKVVVLIVCGGLLCHGVQADGNSQPGHTEPTVPERSVSVATSPSGTTLWYTQPDIIPLLMPGS